MRVALINSVVSGSSGGIVLDLSRMLKKNGIDNTVFYGIGTCDDSEIKSYRFNTPLEVKISILLTRLFGRHSFYSVLATKRLIKKLKEYKPEVVHLHQMHGHYINIKLLFEYLKKENIKTIWTCHDCWAVTGHCACFSSCEKWISGCSNCTKLNEYPISICDASSINWKKKKELTEDWENLIIVTPSLWLKSIFEKSFLKDKTICCIYNGIDRNIFYPNAKSEFKKKYNLENKFVIFSVYKEGRSRPEIYGELANTLKSNEVLVICGVDRRTKKHLPKSVISLPYVSKKEIAEIYSAADVYFHGVSEESFGLVLAESISCGTPVVCFNRTAIPEIVGDCGIALDKFDAKSVYDAVQAVKKGKYDCGKRAAELFDKDKNYAKYLELYGM